jgi:succinylglutamate desuccinylase
MNGRSTTPERPAKARMNDRPDTTTARASLRELDQLPEGLLERDSTELAAVLGGPTLIHLDGERAPPLFVSVLMHGNEPVGWEAVRELLLAYRRGAGGRCRLPRAMSLFIGNVEAATQRQRRLPGQPDFNRVWPGSELSPTPEHALMAEVVARMTERGCFASVDLHNNTGCNPHYACVNVIDSRFLHLATLFSRTVVYFIRPTGVQSQAMAHLCPAVTLECGKVGEQHGVEHARDYLDACLRLAQLPDHPVPAHDIDLFHTVAQVKVPPDLQFCFAPCDADLMLNPELERFNFRELSAGTAFGRIASASSAVVDCRDEHGRDVTARYFTVADGELRLRQPVMPSMLTSDTRIIRQDCLCYLMERYNDHVPPQTESLCPS